MGWREKLSKGIEQVKTRYRYAKGAHDYKVNGPAYLKDYEEDAYLKQKEKEAVKYGVERAKYESKQRIKSIKSGGNNGAGGIFGTGISYNPQGSMLGSSKGGSLLGNSPAMGGMLWGSSSKPKHHKKRHHKSSGKTITIKL